MIRLFVGLYSSKFVGGPISELETKSIALEGEQTTESVFSLISDSVVNLLTNNRDQLRDDTIIDTISSNGIVRPLDIDEINNYLEGSGITILVGQYVVAETGFDPFQEDMENIASRVILSTPMGESVDDLLVFNILDADEFRIEDVAAQWVQVYNIGRVVPVSNINNVLYSLNELFDSGLPITEAHRNLLLRELDKYGVRIIVVQ